MQDSTTRRVVLPAVVGSTVALIFAPLSQTCSFYLNDYLSRSILSIEYVDVVPDYGSVPVPREQTQALLDSDGVRVLQRIGSTAAADLYPFRGQSEILTAEVPGFIQALDRLRSRIADRIEDLHRYQNRLTETQAKADVMQVAAAYEPHLSPTALQDLSALRSSLVSRIGVEAESLRESASIANGLSELLKEPDVKQPRGAFFKLSILNRGKADGLVRHFGLVSLGPAAVSIRRVDPPKSQPSTPTKGVAVFVTNPPPVSRRASAVTKVPKESMEDLWFGIDVSSAKPNDLAVILDVVGRGAYEELAFSLKTHRDQELRYDPQGR